MHFKKKLKQSLAAGLAFVTMASMIVPVMAASPAEVGVDTLGDIKPSIKISNRYGKGTDNDSRAIFGAEFEIKKSGTYNKDTGEIVKDGEETSLGKLQISKFTGADAKVDVSKELTEYGSYNIYQTKRAPGMLANQNLKEAGKTDKDFLQARAEFPMMAKDGRFDPTQVFELHPKYDPLLTNVVVNKKGDDGKTALDNVEFGLEYVSNEANTAFENYSRTQAKTATESKNIINAMTAKSVDGKATFADLPVGIYKLTETKTVEGYQQATEPMYFVVYSDKELATTKDDVKIVALTTDNFDKATEAFKASIDYDTKDDVVLNSIKGSLEKSNLTGENDNIELINYKTPTVKKEIVAQEKVIEEGETLTTIPGSTFKYKFESNIPGDFAEYKEFSFSDTIDSRINYKGNVKLSVGDNALTETTHYTVTEPTGDNNKLEIALTTDGIKEVAKGKVLTVTFDAEVNDTAENNVGIDNKVDLSYANKFDGDGKKESENVTVKIFKGDVKITKVDGSDKTTPLEGATFQLFTKADLNEAYKNPLTGETLTAQTGKDGVATFSSLPTGTYYLKEIKAPDGYKLSSAFYEMVVSKNEDGNIKVEIKNNLASSNIVGDATTGYSFTNYSTNSFMPDTGTRGLVPYAVITVVLLGASTVVLNKKKENA